jgi:hypothetical protein
MCCHCHRREPVGSLQGSWSRRSSGRGAFHGRSVMIKGRTWYSRGPALGHVPRHPSVSGQERGSRGEAVRALESGRAAATRNLARANTS